MSDIDLRPYGYAPGDYSCNCQKCHHLFFGDKRAITCRPCAKTMQAATYVSEVRERAPSIADVMQSAVDYKSRDELQEEIATLRKELADARNKAPDRITLEKLPVAFEVLDLEDGLYVTRSEEAAIASGHEYNGLYRRDGSGANLNIERERENWKLNCQYLLDILDNQGFMSSDLGEDDEGEIERIRDELSDGEDHAAGR